MQTLRLRVKFQINIITLLIDTLAYSKMQNYRILPRILDVLFNSREKFIVTMIHTRKLRNYNSTRG